MKTSTELLAEHRPAAVQIGGSILNYFGYHKAVEGVWLVGDPEEATDGGYGRPGLQRLALGGERGDTEEAVAAWAAALFNVEVK